MTFLPLLANATLQDKCLPFSVQVSRRIRRQLRRFSKISRAERNRLLIYFLLTLLILTTILYTAMHFSNHSRTSFDDVLDMHLVELEDEEYIQRLRNSTQLAISDPLQDYNKTEVHLGRIQWDYVYGELVRNPNPPTLTKYKTRLLRELLNKTQYKLGTRQRLARGVSCNYANNVGDEDSPHTFECAPTSHRCQDGSFFPGSAFVPKEGTSISWAEVVIVMLLSEGREDFLRAAIDTWIARLQKEATLFFVLDRGMSLPQELLLRPNTFTYEFAGSPGLETLDFKAILGWRQVHKLFSFRGKKYFLKIDDDTFLLGHNLIRYLNKIEHVFGGMEEALYFGHPFCGHGDLKALNHETWCYAGGGAYGLSFEALTIFLKQVKDGCAYFYDYLAQAPNMRPENDKYGGHYEDVMVGRCIRQARTRLHDRGTSLLACGSFFPYAPLHYYEAFGKSKEAMCNKMGGDPITIHNLEPSAILFLNHLIYEYPLGGEVKPFSLQNEHVQELIDYCHMTGKKMSCDMTQVL